MDCRSIIIAAILAAATVQADGIKPVAMTHTASGAQVYVACYWVGNQFPNRDALSEKHLLIACRKSTWDAIANGKQAKIREGIGRLLSGEVRLTKARLQAIRDQLADANIYIALTDDPQAYLAGLGLTQGGEQ